MGSFGKLSWWAKVEPGLASPQSDCRAIGSLIEEAAEIEGDADASDSLSDLDIAMTFALEFATFDGMAC